MYISIKCVGVFSFCFKKAFISITGLNKLMSQINTSVIMVFLLSPLPLQKVFIR